MTSGSEHAGPTLVEQRLKLEQATKDRIQALLKEDQDNHARTATRHDQILAELKQLGWKRPRKAAEASVQGSASGAASDAT